MSELQKYIDSCNDFFQKEKTLRDGELTKKDNIRKFLSKDSIVWEFPVGQNPPATTRPCWKAW